MKKLPNIIIVIIFLFLVFVHYSSTSFSGNDYTTLYTIQNEGNHLFLDTPLKSLYLDSLFFLTRLKLPYLRIVLFILYTINALLLFLCIQRITRSDLISFIAAVLTITFPLHIFNLVNISASYEIIRGIFIFLILLLQSKSTLKKHYLFLASLIYSIVLFFDSYFILILYFVLVLEMIHLKKGGEKTFFKFCVLPYCIPTFIIVTMKTILNGISHLYTYLPSFKQYFCINVVKYVQWLIIPENLTIFKGFIRRFPIFSYTLAFILFLTIVLLLIRHLRFSTLNLTLMITILLSIMLKSGLFSFGNLYVPSMLFSAFLPLMLWKKMKKPFLISFFSLLSLFYMLLLFNNLYQFKISNDISTQILNKMKNIKYDSYYIVNLPESYRSKIPVFINEQNLNYALKLSGKKNSTARVLSFLFIDKTTQEDNYVKVNGSTINVKVKTNANYYLSLNSKVKPFQKFYKGQEFSDRHAEYTVRDINKQKKISQLEIKVKEWHPVYEFRNGNLLLIKE